VLCDVAVCHPEPGIRDVQQDVDGLSGAVPGTTHYVYVDAPKVAADAIRDVLHRANKSTYGLADGPVDVSSRRRLMAQVVTLEDLARWSGEPVDELRQWVELGLLSAGDLTLADLERVRLIRFTLTRGYTAARLAEVMARSGDVISLHVASFGARSAPPVSTLEEAASRVGIELETVEQLRIAAGLAVDGYVDEVDIDAIRLMKVALEGGLPLDVLAQILRVLSDATGKIADSASRLFHMYVHEPLRAKGRGGEELLRETNALALPMLSLVEPALLFFHRKAWERALAEDLMVHLAEETTVPSEVPGSFDRAFLFVDLSGFTPMTEAMGDAAAVEVVARFAEVVRQTAAQGSGQVVKQIGDEFMLVFADASEAVRCGLAIRERFALEPRSLPLRLGAHFGPVMFREGDYVGIAVNTAARVTATASRHQFLVTGSVREQLAGLEEVEVLAVGERSLKGLTDAVELFELRGAGPRPGRTADPVCGMELDEAASQAELSWQGDRLLFCSAACLRQFLEDPARYEATPESVRGREDSQQ